MFLAFQPCCSVMRHALVAGVAICCVEMFQSFGHGFYVLNGQIIKSYCFESAPFTELIYSNQRSISVRRIIKMTKALPWYGHVHCTVESVKPGVNRTAVHDGQRSQEARNLGQDNRLRFSLDRVFCRTGKHLAVSLPLLQKWRRWVQIAFFERPTRRCLWQIETDSFSPCLRESRSTPLADRSERPTRPRSQRAEPGAIQMNSHQSFFCTPI